MTTAESLPQRKKLQLKPRSEDAAARVSGGAPTAAKSNPFGAAKPREEVLKSRGIDAKAIDSKIEKKAQVMSFTEEQETQVEAVRAELTEAEEKLRDANENELPEEEFRLVVEDKRKELKDLMEKFSKMNAEDPKFSARRSDWVGVSHDKHHHSHNQHGDRRSRRGSDRDRDSHEYRHYNNNNRNRGDREGGGGRFSNDSHDDNNRRPSWND